METKEGKWHPLETGDVDEWEIPDNSVMPFGRVDLEIWLHTDLGIKYLGVDNTNPSFQSRYMRRRHLGENGVIRNLLTATLSAANTVGRCGTAEQKLTNLAESLYTNPLINSDPFCCEFTVYHLSVSRAYFANNQRSYSGNNEYADTGLEKGSIIGRDCRHYKLISC